MTARDALRDGLKIDKSNKVALVIYEAQTEQMWRALLPSICQNYRWVLVYPITESDRRLLTACYHGEFENVRIVSAGVAEAADEIVAFRFVEDVLTQFSGVVRVADPANRWLTKELSYDTAK